MSEEIISEVKVLDSGKLLLVLKSGGEDSYQYIYREAWLAQFISDAELYDDGNKRDFMKFTNSAIGEERFTSIDKVKNDGKNIYGHFYTEKWGEFDTYFKFHINNENKIYRLDIGQA